MTEMNKEQEDVRLALEKIYAYDRSNPKTPKIFDPAYLTDVGNARCLVEKYGMDIHYVSAWKAWTHWNGKIWERLDEDKQGYPQLLKEWAKDIANSYREMAYIIPNPTIAADYKEHAKRSESDAKIKAMLNLITGEREIIKSYKDFDNKPFLFSCQNGTFNLLAQEPKERFREHRREDYITKIAPVVYDVDAECPLWISFLERIMKKNPEMIQYLQNLAGQCLTGEVREKAFWIFWGAGGDNGKTTFVETLKYILNEYAQTIPINALIKENKTAIPVDLHSLNGARFAFASEPDFGDTLTDGLIKRITGKDTMKTRTLHEKPTEWNVQFKLVILANHQPKIPDASGAMWSRVKCVPFIEKIPLAEQDKQLVEKLKSEAPGILNWMLEGCRQWLDNGMAEPEIVRQTVADYKEDSDKLADYFNYFFETQYDGFVPFKIYYTLYRLWCANHEIRPVSENTLPQLLAARGYQRGRAYYNNYNNENIRDRGNFGFRLQTWLTTDLSVQSVPPVPKKQGESNQIVSPASTGQTIIKNGRLQDRLTGQTIVPPVLLILETADTDFEQAKWLVGQRDRANQVSSIYLASCKNNENDMSYLSSLSQDNDNASFPVVSYSVPSVPSVPKYKEIIIVIKELLDNINKPNSIKELEDLEEKILTELQTDLKYDNVDGDIIRKAIHDYFKVRGWV
jgi:putative DNA primase/helicase